MSAKSDFQKTLELDHDSTCRSAYSNCFLGDNEKGYELQKKIIEKSIKKNSEYYNMACLYSIMGDEKNAILYLDNALKNGYSNYEWMKNDDDLKPLRDKSSFLELMKKYTIQ